MKRIFAALMILVLASVAIFANGEKEEQAAAQKKVVMKIPVYDRSRPELPPVDDNFWTKWVQKEFGDPNNITVQYVAIPRGETTAKFNTLIAANDCTDLIFDYDMPVAMSFYKMGALKELDMNKVRQAAPNYVRLVGEDTLKYGVVGGKQVFLPALRPAAYNWVGLIRQDWLDKVGLAVPKTRDEMDNALRAFKKAGLGTPHAHFLPSAYFGAYAFRPYPVPEKDLALYSDVGFAALNWEPVRKNLLQDNRRYNEGLLSPEFFLDKDGKAALADWVAGRVGVYSCYLSNQGIIQPLLENAPNAKVAYLPISVGFNPGETVTYRKYWPFGMLNGIYVNSKNEEAVLKFLNWMADPKVLFTFQNGFEGKHYTMSAEGLPALNSAYKGEDGFMYNSNKDMWCAVIEGKDFGSVEKNVVVQRNTFAPQGYGYLIEEAAKDNIANDKTAYPDFLWSSAPTWNNLQASLRDKWQQLYVSLVTCKPGDFEATYRKAVEEYLAAGFQKVLDDKAAAYKAQTGK